MLRKKSILSAALLSLFVFGATSCDDNLVYDKEQDCTPKVQFIFKKHRQALHSAEGREADVFYSTVGSVHVFIYDSETGELIFEKTEKTDNLQSAAQLKIGSSHDKCYMPVDIEPGNYRVVAWCGLDENDENNAFHLAESGRASQYSHCNIKYADGTTRPVSDAKYDALYHGRTGNMEVKYEGGEAPIIPVELTKNTNDIAVWVQHTTKTFENGDYEVVYTDANGTMRFEDNSMLNDTRLEYRPHTTSTLTANTEYNGSVVESGAMVAHISTSRLMEQHAQDARLEVRTREGDVVFSIPFIKYVLQMQTLTNNSQYYLDCEDTYNCSFYLSGESGTWMPARIIINNWVVVPGQSDTL